MVTSGRDQGPIPLPSGNPRGSLGDISCIRPISTSLLRLLAAALLLAAPACAHDDTRGRPLPDAALTSLETGEAARWDADGRPLVINFWASWCTPCRAEMPAFEQVHQQLGDRVAIVGVTDETDHGDAAGAAERAGVSYPLLVDVEQTLLIDLAISGLPGTVFVDADGTVLGRHLGALTEDQLIDEIEDRYGITE